MSQIENISKGKSLLTELAIVCRGIDDCDIPKLFGDGAVEELFTAILDPRKVADFPSIAEYFLANKHRASFMAAIRNAIGRSYAVKVEKSGVTGYASPNEIQWFDDGVMILEGGEPFSGLIGLYRDGRMSYATALRDAKAGDMLGPSDFSFVDMEETKRYFERQSVTSMRDLDAPVRELRQLLATGCSDESIFQQLFSRYPWVLGLHYQSIQRHEALDDRNIPDFTGVLVTDGFRDIFEVKPPSMKIFRNDGEFSAEFNTAWNQAERYLDFAREEKDYLLRKGLQFDNPKCLLISGYNLESTHIPKIRLKQRLNPAIQLLTFNDVLVYMESTVAFIRRLAADRINFVGDPSGSQADESGRQ